MRNNLYFEKFSNEPLDGSFEQYWPNGQLHKIAHFNLGVLDGLAEEYLDDGRLLNQLLFKDGNFVESQSINYFDKSFDEFWLYGYEEEEIKKIKKKFYVLNWTRDDKVLSIQANTYSKCGFLVGKINTVLNIQEPFEQNTLVPKDDTINSIGESYNSFLKSGYVEKYDHVDFIKCPEGKPNLAIKFWFDAEKKEGKAETYDNGTLVETKKLIGEELDKFDPFNPSKFNNEKKK